MSPRRSLTGAGICGALASVYFLASWWVIFALKIGPVVATIDAQAGHGIHEGDALGLVFGAMGIVCAMAAFALADKALRPRHAVATVTVRRPSVTRSRSVSR